MKSNGARALVALAAIVVLVVGFILLTGEDEAGEGSADPPVASAPAETTAEEAAGGGSGGDPSEPAEKPKPADELTTIVVKGGEPEGGVAELDYDVGDEVRFAVSSDAADAVHVHGYDIEQEVAAGETTEFAFPADLDGIYEVELHESAAQIAELTVNP